MKAYRKFVRISPRKVNIVAGLVRGKRVQDALSLLEATNKKAAVQLHKAIKSASANAVNNFAQDETALLIKRLLVQKGPILKRIRPASKGRARRELKRTCHILVEVGI